MLFTFIYEKQFSLLFSTAVNAFQTVLMLTLGSFDYHTFKDAHPVLGRLYFLVYVLLTILVLVNMLIAIICDSFAAVGGERSENKYEIVDFLYGRIRQMLPASWTRRSVQMNLEHGFMEDSSLMEDSPLNIEQGSQMMEYSPVKIQQGSQLMEYSPLKIQEGSLMMEYSPLKIKHGSQMMEYSRFRVKQGSLMMEYSPMKIKRGSQMIEYSPLKITHGSKTVEYSPLKIKQGLLMDESKANVTSIERITCLRNSGKAMVRLECQKTQDRATGAEQAVSQLLSRLFRMETLLDWELGCDTFEERLLEWVTENGDRRELVIQEHSKRDSDAGCCERESDDTASFVRESDDTASFVSFVSTSTNQSFYSDPD